MIVKFADQRGAKGGPMGGAPNVYGAAAYGGYGQGGGMMGGTYSDIYPHSCVYAYSAQQPDITHYCPTVLRKSNHEL